MNCPDCASAASERHWGGYVMTCLDCRARLIAGSPAYYASELSRRILPEYRAALETVGAGSIEAAHRLVRQWRERIDDAPAGRPR